MHYIRTATLYHGNPRTRYNLMRKVVPTLLDTLEHSQRLVLGLRNVFGYNVEIFPLMFDRISKTDFLLWLDDAEEDLLCMERPATHAEFICIVVEKEFDPLTFVPPDGTDEAVVEVLMMLRHVSVGQLAAA